MKQHKHQNTKKTPAEILLMVGVLVFNVLLWGGGAAAALGYPFGMPMLYAAFLSVLVVGWGGPMLLVVFETKKLASKSGPLVAAKAVCSGVFVIFAWIGGFAIAVCLLRACDQIALYGDGDSAVCYWLTFGIAFSVFICPFVFIGLIVRETITTRLSEYQCHLIDQFPADFFDSVRYPRVETPHHDPAGIPIRDRFLVNAIKSSSNFAASTQDDTTGERKSVNPSDG